MGEQDVEGREEIDYFKVLEDECWDLRCVAEPTGGDDSDIAWHVIGHWMSQPQERVIGYGRTPPEAIKDAMRPRDYEGNLLDEDAAGARVVAPWPVREHRPTFQSRVRSWMVACFGPIISADKEERNHRFLEEALELVQACGCRREDCHQLVEYVYDRPVGEPSQEVGGVRVTLAALCDANDISEVEAAEIELARVWTKIDIVRAKQAAKPRGSALPMSPSYPPAQPDKAEVEGRCLAAFIEKLKYCRAVNHQEPDHNCESCFRQAVRAALSILPPQRDDSGLVEDLVRALDIANGCIKASVLLRDPQWDGFIADGSPLSLIRHALQRAAQAKAGAL